ncbi:hypothetical protein NL50_16330 [Clostridium acetobutylicum]|nr:hypothetical protein NL50_16330 [Clostridium acetobutylicum]
MENKVEYCTEKKGAIARFYFGIILFSIVGVIYLPFSIFMLTTINDVATFIICALMFGASDYFMFFKMCKPMVMLLAKAKFKIVFFNDSFHYKGMMKDEIIKYEDIEKLTKLCVDGPHGRLEGDKGVLMIELKGKGKHNKIYINLGGLKEENVPRLEKELEARIAKKIGAGSKSIFSIK